MVSVSGASNTAAPAVLSVTNAPLPSDPPVDVVTDPPPIVVQEVLSDGQADGASAIDPPPAHDLPSDHATDVVAMDSSVSSPPATRDLAHDPDAGNSSIVVPPPANTESRVSDGSTFSLPTDPLANILRNSPKELVPRPPLLSTNSSDVSPDLFTPPAPVSDGGGVSSRRSSRPKVNSTGRKKSLRPDDSFAKMKGSTSSVYLSRKQCSPSPLPTTRTRSQSLFSLDTNRFAPLTMDNDGDHDD